MDEIARARGRRGAVVMGVCNVTPDSFSDGGEHADTQAACARIDALVREGARVVDVGGESTRPGAPRVSPSAQIERIADVIAYAKDHCVVSVDTTSAEVAAVALERGAHAVNDVSLLSEPALADVVARYGAALVLSHARGFQEDMRGYGAWPDSSYGDIVDDVLREFDEKRSVAIARGVPRDAFVMDPGLGFSKSANHSLTLLRRVAELCARAGAPVLVGASRKSFLGSIVGETAPRDRLGASIAAAVFAQENGAAMVRVHDVLATSQALAVAASLGGPAPVGSPASASSRGEEARC